MDENRPLVLWLELGNIKTLAEMNVAISFMIVNTQDMRAPGVFTFPALFRRPGFFHSSSPFSSVQLK
jgi:hypothetical protein